MLLFDSTNKCTLPTVQTNARMKHVQTIQRSAAIL